MDSSLTRKKWTRKGFYICYQKKLVLDELRLRLWPLLLFFSSPFFIFPAFLSLLVESLHLHLSWPRGSIRCQGIIIGIIIIRIVCFFPFPPLVDVATAIFNIASFTAILFRIITARGGSQEMGVGDREKEGPKTRGGRETRQNRALKKALFLFVLLEHP